MAESRNKLVYIVLDELDRPISLGGMEDGDTIDNRLLSPSATQAIDRVHSTSADWDGAYTSAVATSAYIQANESSWLAGGAASAEGFELWTAAYAEVDAGSGGWNNTFSKVDSASDGWDGAYASALTASAYIQANESSWLAGGAVSAEGFELWNATYAEVNDGSGNWNDTYAVIASVSANHFLSSVDGVSLLDGNLEIGNNKTISSIGSYTLSADNIITLAPGGNLNLSSDSNVRLIPTGEVKIQPTGAVYISGVGVTLESDDGNFSIGTNGGTTTVYDLVTVLDDAIDTKASAIALNIWSGTVDTSVVDLDADITTLDGRVVAVESLVPSAAGFADWNATKATVDAGAANWNTAYTTDLFPSAAGFEGWNTTKATVDAGAANWNTAYSTDLFPSAAGFADWNATKDTVDAGAADWDGAYASALTASAYILDNEAAWLAGGGSDNPSGTASAMGVYLGSSVAISGFGPGDATPTGPIANQYLAFKASDSRFRYVEPPLRFTTTDQVSINPQGMLDLEGGGGTANSFGLDIGLSLSGWVNQNDYDITVTPGLPDSYTIDIDFDQSHQQTANLTAVSGDGATLGINFSNISAGRKVNLTIINPTYTITTIPVISGATWMTTQLTKLAAGETVEITVYSRGSTTSDLYLYSTQIDSDQVRNESTVAGAAVTDALDQLDTAKRNVASYISRQNSATQDLNGTNVAANWGQAVASNGSDLSWSITNPSRIAIATTGDYRVTFNLVGTSTAQRANIIAQLRVNGTTFRGPSSACGYIRSTNGHDTASVHAAFIHPFTSGDYIEIVCNQEAAAGDWTTINGECSISLEYLG